MASFKNYFNYTRIKIYCFGIVEDTSKLKYDITSFIKNGAKRSVVNQNSKILLFDKESTGINNPILEIEENDVKANHQFCACGAFVMFCWINWRTMGCSFAN